VKDRACDPWWWADAAPDKNVAVDRERPEDLAAQLCEASLLCDFVRVRDLLARGADPDARDEEGRTPLHQAVLGNSLGLVGLLIESGATLDAKDRQGFTPLHFAAQEHTPEIARVLVGKGANVNAQDEDGNSVLWRAVFSARGRDDIVRFLLESGAHDDLANHEGVTPRDLATRLGSRAFTAN
jgi:ankyrin repeat protein